MISGNPKKILLYLKQFNCEEIFIPNHYELAINTDIKHSSIKTTVQRLKNLGFINIEYTDGGFLIYLTDLANEFFESLSIETKGKTSPIEQKIINELIKEKNHKDITFFNSHDVADKLNTTVNTIRTALTRLQKKGLVEKLG